jgi:hypothetical protein
MGQYASTALGVKGHFMRNGTVTEAQASWLNLIDWVCQWEDKTMVRHVHLVNMADVYESVREHQSGTKRMGSRWWQPAVVCCTHAPADQGSLRTPCRNFTYSCSTLTLLPWREST